MSLFAYESLSQLSDDCVKFYNKNLRENTEISSSARIIKKRRALAKWIWKFHHECGTVSSEIEESLGNLKETPCLLLMTAHQPNLFAYSGVLRKATLLAVLAKNLFERLHVPVVCFFGIADQDFTDDRWVRSATLPDVERQNGILELRVNLPDKLMINKVEKPSKQILNNWHKEIETWYSQKLCYVEKFCRDSQLSFDTKQLCLAKNFEDFWKFVERAYDKAGNYADFNAFLISEIVNDAWGYPILFARFSECQQELEEEFCSMLTRFEEYSHHVKEATRQNAQGGVSLDECHNIPFWFHCECGGKARLTARLQGDNVVGIGSCIRCGKEHLINFASRREPELRHILARISARSISMPLTFFEAFNVCAYIGGAGGKEYLRQAKYIAEQMNTSFPPIVVWRPRDFYVGIGLLDALIRFRSLSGTFSISQYPNAVNNLRKKLSDVQETLGMLDLQKKALVDNKGINQQERVQGLRAISERQNKIRSETGLSLMVRNLKLLENFISLLNLNPCIVDYAVNIGLSETNEAWKTFLKENGSLATDVNIPTYLGKFLGNLNPKFEIEWKELTKDSSLNESMGTAVNQAN